MVHTHWGLEFHKSTENLAERIETKNDQVSGSSCQLAGSTDAKIYASPKFLNSWRTTSTMPNCLFLVIYLNRYFAALNLGGLTRKLPFLLNWVSTLHLIKKSYKKIALRNWVLDLPSGSCWGQCSFCLSWPLHENSRIHFFHNLIIGISTFLRRKWFYFYLTGLGNHVIDLVSLFAMVARKLRIRFVARAFQVPRIL